MFEAAVQLRRHLLIFEATVLLRQHLLITEATFNNNINLTTYSNLISMVKNEFRLRFATKIVFF